MASASTVMARWYASVNDDVRYHLVERGWYGQEIPSHNMREDVEATLARRESEPPAPQEVVSDRETELSAPESSNHSVYDGEDRAGRDPMADWYGQTRERQAEAADLYGDRGGQDERQPEIEQDY